MKSNTLPPYSTFPVIANEKIPLKQILDSDLNELIEISFYDSIQATNIEQAVEMHAKINNDYNNGNSIHWGIIDNQTNKIVGTCGYYRGFDKLQGELGCVLLPQYSGQGFMTSALLLAINFGLKNIGLKRIWAVTNKKNEKALKLLERIGFKETKFLKEDDIELELKSDEQH